MEYTEYNNMKRIEELETAVRVLSQDLAHTGAQISELIRMYSQLDAKINRRYGKMKVKIIRDTMNEELEVLFSFGYVKEGEVYEAYEYYDEYGVDCICVYADRGEEFNIYKGEYEVVE